MMAGGYQTTSFYHDKPGSLSLASCISYILRTKQKEVLTGSQNGTDFAENKRFFCCDGNAMSPVCRYRKSQNFCRGIHKFITARSKLNTIFCQSHSFPFLTVSPWWFSLFFSSIFEEDSSQHFEDQTSVGVSFAHLDQVSLN